MTHWANTMKKKKGTKIWSIAKPDKGKWMLAQDLENISIMSMKETNNERAA